MLSINIWELLWTVVNFFLLLLILRNLLYKPLIRFMDSRQARIDAGFDEERRAQEAYDSEKARLLYDKNRCMQEAKDRSERAKAEYEARCEQLSRRLRGETADKRQELKRAVAEISGGEKARFDANERELAELLLEKLISADAPGAE